MIEEHVRCRKKRIYWSIAVTCIVVLVLAMPVVRRTDLGGLRDRMEGLPSPASADYAAPAKTSPGRVTLRPSLPLCAQEVRDSDDAGLLDVAHPAHPTWSR